MTYAQALRALEDRQESRMELGLSRVKTHLARLGLPHLSLPVIHVAGTNGKGSVCAILDAVLRAQGYKTGLYTSPHFLNVRERIKINGRAVDESGFASLISQTLKADPGGRLTYFELMTSMAFQHFHRNRVDIVVLETGLGGRLDATNAVEKPLACVITSIDFDHMNYLGPTIAKIAGEKAGIIKRGCPVIVGPLRPEAMRVVVKRAKSLRAPLTTAAKGWRTGKVDWPMNRQSIKSPDGNSYVLSLLGTRQAQNVSLARAALDALKGVLPIAESSWSRGLSLVHWPGRFDVRRLGGKTAILDGGHNVEAVSALVETLKSSPWKNKKIRFILGMLKDKDYAGVIKALAPVLTEVVVVSPPSPRALDALDLACEVRRRAPLAHVSVERDCRTALKFWRAKPGPATAVVCGSFYLAASAARALETYAN